MGFFVVGEKPCSYLSVYEAATRLMVTNHALYQRLLEPIEETILFEA